jgi:hypothetical protein
MIFLISWLLSYFPPPVKQGLLKTAVLACRRRLFLKFPMIFSGSGQISPKSVRKSAKFLRGMKKWAQKSQFKPQKRGSGK